MKTYRVTITPGSPPWKSLAAVNGVDISRAVQRVAIELDAREAYPTVSLALNSVEIEPMEAAEAQIVLTAPTREALIVLGWTPPPEET